MHYSGLKAEGCGCVFSLRVGLTWQPTGSPLPVCGWWQSSEPFKQLEVKVIESCQMFKLPVSVAVGGSVTFVCLKQCENRHAYNSWGSPSVIRRRNDSANWKLHLLVSKTSVWENDRKWVMGGTGREGASEMQWRGREQARGREGSSQEVSQIV